MRAVGLPTIAPAGRRAIATTAGAMTGTTGGRISVDPRLVTIVDTRHITIAGGPIAIFEAGQSAGSSAIGGANTKARLASGLLLMRWPYALK